MIASYHRRLIVSIRATAEHTGAETRGLAQGATRADVAKALAEHKPLAMAESIGVYQKQPAK